MPDRWLGSGAAFEPTHLRFAQTLEPVRPISSEFPLIPLVRFIEPLLSKQSSRLAELFMGGITLGALRLSNVLGTGLIALAAFGPQALPAGIVAAFVAGTPWSMGCLRK